MKPDFQGYEYRCIDKSITLPFFKAYCRLYFSLVPSWLTANCITLISSACMWILLVLSSLLEPKGIYGLLFAFLMHAYVVGDHLDGMQAKHTKTSSPLGEFLDHYLDCFNSAIAITVCCLWLSIPSAEIVFITIWISYLAFASTLVAEKETGVLYFGAISSLEAVLCLIVLFATAPYPPLWEWWHSSIEGVPTFWLLLGSSLLGFLSTIVTSIIILKHCPLALTKFFIGGTVLSVFIIEAHNKNILPFWGGWILLSCYSGHYISKVLYAHISKGESPSPSSILPIAAFIGLILLYLVSVPQSIITILGWVITICGVVLLGNTLFQIWPSLKIYWRWTND